MSRTDTNQVQTDQTASQADRALAVASYRAGAGRTTGVAMPRSKAWTPPAELMAALKPNPLTAEDRKLIQRLRDAHTEIVAQLRKKIIGQEEIVEQLLISFFAGGHALLIGVPGLAKTMMIRSLSEVLNLDFNRIQFTPDLMPSDITGAEVIGDDKETDERGFRFLGGPIFANMILADEINRTPPKTLAALLEAMEEFTVHVGGRGFDLPKPFFVLATQNPIEQEGTYTLPAAALDRFMFNILVDYPDEDTEQLIVEMTTSRDEENLPVVLGRDEITQVLQVARKLPVPDSIVQYAVDLVRHTRVDETPLATVREYVAWGASPRATQALLMGAKVRAMLHGREKVLPDDLRAIALPVLRHRMMSNFHAESEGVTLDDLIRHIVRDCPRPAGDVHPDLEARRQQVADAAGGIGHWLWGSETRRSLEARALHQREKEPTRLDKLMTRSRRRRLSVREMILAVLLLAVTGVFAASAVMLFGEIGKQVTVVDGGAQIGGAIVASLFAAALLAASIGVILGRNWGTSLALPTLGLLILVELFAFMFSQGQPHKVFSVLHLSLLEMGGLLYGEGTDWAVLGLMLLAAVPFGMMFSQND